MARSPYGGAIRRALELTYRRLIWSVEPASQEPADVEAATFVQECMGDLSGPWSSFVNQVISNTVEQGFALFEITYKSRRGERRPDRRRSRQPADSKYDDGRIGWDALELRPADTIVEWDIPPARSWQGVWQTTTDVNHVYIPKQKLLLFRIDDRTGSPTGSGGIFDDSYRSYYFIRELQNIEAIVEERMGGFPVVKLPEGADLDQSDPDSDWSIARDMVERFRADEMMGFVLPFGYEVQIMNPGSGQRQIRDTIESHKRDFFLSLLAQWAMLGSTRIGSFALSRDQSDFFVMALAGWLMPLKDILNEVGIPRLINLNPFPGRTGLPVVTHSPLTVRDVNAFTGALGRLVPAGLLVPDQADNEYFRKELGLPKATEPADLSGLPGRAPGGVDEGLELDEILRRLSGNGARPGLDDAASLPDAT